MSETAEESQSPTQSPATKLYSFANFDRSARARWLLLEMGLPFEDKRLDFAAGDHKSAAFRAISPFALVPGLQTGEIRAFDSGAILLTLLEGWDSDLAPAPGDGSRPRFLSWLFALCASLDPYAIDLYFILRQDDAPENMIQTLRTKVAKRLEVLEQELSAHPYLVEDRFSACDIVLGHLLGILQRVDELRPYPALRGYLKRLMDRPAANKAGLFDGVELEGSS